MPVAYLKALADYWRSGYDWREHEAQLNQFPQSITEIDGQQLHFAHADQDGGVFVVDLLRGRRGMPVDQTKVPTGVSHAGPGIRRLAERRNTIVHWSDDHSPSHMVAMAVPDQLVGDIREFFRRLR